MGRFGSLDDGVIIVKNNASDNGLAPNSEHPPLFTSKPLYIALVALTLLLTVFMLQVFGLSYAVGAAKHTAPSVSWCSPIFQPFGVAVLDGDCNVWSIEQTFTKGV